MNGLSHLEHRRLGSFVSIIFMRDHSFSLFRSHKMLIAKVRNHLDRFDILHANIKGWSEDQEKQSQRITVQLKLVAVDLYEGGIHVYSALEQEDLDFVNTMWNRCGATELEPFSKVVYFDQPLPVIYKSIGHLMRIEIRNQNNEWVNCVTSLASFRYGNTRDLFVVMCLYHDEAHENLYGIDSRNISGLLVLK